MSGVNDSLPGALNTVADERLERGGNGTRSEHLQERIGRDRDREHLRRLLIEGAESEPRFPADDAFFRRLRGRVERLART